MGTKHDACVYYKAYGSTGRQKTRRERRKHERERKSKAHKQWSGFATRRGNRSPLLSGQNFQSHPPNPQYMLRKERETAKEVGKEHERGAKGKKSPRPRSRLPEAQPLESSGPLQKWNESSHSGSLRFRFRSHLLILIPDHRSMFARSNSAGPGFARIPAKIPSPSNAPSLKIRYVWRGHRETWSSFRYSYKTCRED